MIIDTYLFFQTFPSPFPPSGIQISFSGLVLEVDTFWQRLDLGEVLRVPVQMVCGFSLLNLRAAMATILCGCPVENITEMKHTSGGI